MAKKEVLSVNRDHVIPVRVSASMYEQLSELAALYDLPVATFCYLSVLKVSQVRRDVLVHDDKVALDLIP